MGIWKDKKRKDWVYRFEAGKQNYVGRGFKTRRDAETGRSKRREEIKAALKLTRRGMGCKEVLSAYLDFSKRMHAKSTYKYKVVNFKAFLKMNDGDFPIMEIKPLHITNYLNTLKSNPVYNARRMDLSAAFNWIIYNYKLTITNPCAEISKMPHTRKVKAVPSEEEVLKLIMVAAPGDEQDIIMCCVHLLGRIDEILRLTWQDVNFEKRAVTLWTRKRKGGALEADDMPMNEDLYFILKKRYDARNHETWVFYNEETQDRYYHRPKMMASLCKRAGIPPIGFSKRKIGKGPKKGQYKEIGLYYGFHSLRHFMASHLADQEKTPMKVLSKLLRHKNLKTTEIYIHSIDESVRSASERITGKFKPGIVLVEEKSTDVK